jgi:hypothetical protein
LVTNPATPLDVLHRIAAPVSVRIVDPLEAIHVDRCQRERLGFATGVDQQPFAQKSGEIEVGRNLAKSLRSEIPADGSRYGRTRFTE